MAGVGWGEQQPGQRSRVEKLLVLDPSLTDGSCCWHLLSPEEMRNAIVQAAGESREKRGGWWSKPPGKHSCQRMGVCWAQELS